MCDCQTHFCAYYYSQINNSILKKGDLHCTHCNFSSAPRNQSEFTAYSFCSNKGGHLAEEIGGYELPLLDKNQHAQMTMPLIH